MKKIMILGASYSLVPLIQAAKRLGYYTIAASIPGDYPGFSVADEACFCDITKPDEVLEAARTYGISGVATCCMDVGLRSQGYVASALGLPGPSWETVQISTDKSRMKEVFLREGVNTAAYFKIYGREDLEQACERLRFPVIIKAVDQMGGRGIFRCDTKEALLASYPKTMAATGRDYCIVEEFLQGMMFGVEVMAEDGQIAFFLPSGDELNHRNPFFLMGHHVPCEEVQSYEDKIREQIGRVIHAYKVGSSPMNFDMMLLDGEIYVIEATVRAGATCLPEMVGIHFGNNYYEMLIRLCVGEKVSPYFRRPKEERVPCIVKLLEAEQAGVVEEILPGTPVGGSLVDLSFNIQKGDTVRLMENGRDRIGQVIVKGGSMSECRAFLKAVLERIQVKVKE